MGCASSKDEAGVLKKAPADGLPSEADVEASSTSPRRQNAAGLTAKTLKAAGRSGPAAVLKLVPARVPGDLPAWSAGLGDGKEAEGWLEAIQAALDALWEPLVSKAEARLAAPGAVPAYDSLKPASLLVLVRDIAGVPDEKQWPAAAACDGLLRMGAALWQRTQGPGRAPSAEVEARFVNASLCRLLAFLSLALTRTVAVEDAARCARAPHPTPHTPPPHARPHPTTARRRRCRRCRPPSHPCQPAPSQLRRQVGHMAHAPYHLWARPATPVRAAGRRLQGLATLH
jgi:hypothetical protein